MACPQQDDDSPVGILGAQACSASTSRTVEWRSFYLKSLGKSRDLPVADWGNTTCCRAESQLEAKLNN